MKLVLWNKLQIKPVIFFIIYSILFSFLTLCNAGYATVIPIASIEELQKIGTDYPLDGEYELSQDIDASDTVNWNDGAGFQPIGNGLNPFIGKFNGNGHKISYLYMNFPDCSNVGLFGYTGTGSEVSNVIIDSSWTVGLDYVGALVGRNLDGTIRNSGGKWGVVYGRYNVGGIVGMNNRTLTLCYSINSVVGENSVGNLSGYNSGSISYCYAVGKVSGLYNTGGLIGENYGLVDNCYSRSIVVGLRYHIGGLIGGTGGPTSSITNCYSTGAVSGLNFVGGLIGSNFNGTTPVTNSYWDKEFSGINTSDGGEGRTTLEMKRKLTYTDWNFNSIWAIVEEIEYPYLIALGPPDITLPPEINITSLDELNKIGRDTEYPWNGIYHLTKDIDASDTAYWDGGKGFTPIKVFFGEFHGHGHSIQNLYINRSEEKHVGLFGLAGPTAVFKDIGLENISVFGAYKVGALVGEMLGKGWGEVNNCYVTGSIEGINYIGGSIGYKKGGVLINNYSYCSISGENYIGGLIGYNEEGLIHKSYFNGSISATNWYCGGIVGYLSYGETANCFAMGYIEGLEKVGGIAGKNYYGTVNNSYSIAHITGSSNVGGIIGYNDSGIVANCFWDVDVSGQNWSDGGVGKSTTEMNQQNTYIGWDFLDTWSIVNECSYPWLNNILNPYLTITPNIIGMSQSEAESLIKDFGLIIGIVSEECNDSIPQGTVIRQLPEENTQSLPCSVIDFVVSSGPCFVEVPNIIGLTQSEAENIITAAGLSLGTVSEQCSEIEAGKVIGQTPEGGTQLSLGSSVNLIVSTGPCSDGEGIREGIWEGEGFIEGATEGSFEGEGTLEGNLEGMVEGTIEGEGTLEGEGISEGEVEGEYYPPHDADPNGDWEISLSELLRIIQFFNMGGYYPCPGQTEDNYCPGKLK
ncbi:MAG TPA: PASTA domain-containing protein [Candidatus Hydrogenedens sp.]|nr:PASTA domain-containing protein [Candidatus Hydrogenedens sp.]